MFVWFIEKKKKDSMIGVNTALGTFYDHQILTLCTVYVIQIMLVCVFFLNQFYFHTFAIYVIQLFFESVAGSGGSILYVFSLLPPKDPSTGK